MWLFNKLENWEEEYFARMFNHNSGNDDGTTVGWGPEGLNARQKEGVDNDREQGTILGGNFDFGAAVKKNANSSPNSFIGGGEDSRLDY